jgi:hypothetical protein
MADVFEYIERVKCPLVGMIAVAESNAKIGYATSFRLDK